MSNQISRRRLLQQAGAASAAGVIGAHGVASLQPAAAQSGTPVRGGSLTWAVEILTDTLPYGAIGQPVTHVFTYDSLILWDSNLQPIPGLAESWEVVDDVTYRFHLREGATFHNGQPVTADDVKYSIDLHREPPAPGQSFSFYPKIDTVEVIDPLTVQINMREVDPALLGYVTWTRYSNIMPSGWHETANVLSEALGSGPYLLTEFETSDRATMVRNENYWDPDVPNIDEINIAFLPDEQSRVAALRAGEIDGGSFSPDIVNVLRANSDLTVLSGLQGNHREIQITTKGDFKPWHDKRVRQAVTHAIDRDDMAAKVYGGEAEYSGVVPTGYGDWPISVDELRSNYLKYDVDLARQLMAEAGFEDGFSVTLQSIAAPRDYTLCAEVAREHLAEIGIDVTVEPLEFGIFAANNGQGEYDWQLTGRGFRGDISGYVNEFSPTSTIFGNWFEGGWENPELTELLAAGLQTADQERRHEIYTQAQRILLEEAVHVTLLQPMVYHVVRNRVKGMQVSFSGDIAYGLKAAWVED